MNIFSTKHFISIFACVILACTSLSSSAQSQAFRSVPDSVTERMKNEKEFLYANDPSYWTRQKPKDNSAFARMIGKLFSSDLLRWSVYILLAAIIIFVLYQVLVVNNFFIFSRSAKKKKKAGEEGENDIPDDIDGKIATSIAAKEYRLAIRYLYLKTLQVLQEHNRIRLSAKATNFDYLQQMQHHAGAKDFRLLTQTYEYVWYGEFQPDTHQFEMIQSNFKQFIARD